MSTLSTHVLDAVAGAPAAGVPVALDRRSAPGSDWTAVARGTTDDDGRISGVAPAPLEPGVYRLVFDTDAYTAGAAAFYPEIAIVFRITEERHYHVPVLLSPFAYSTYRGS
ncbi:hydroxyisourate hydrolase [Geodermatophilus sp. URMC 64]